MRLLRRAPASRGRVCSAIVLAVVCLVAEGCTSTSDGASLSLESRVQSAVDDFLKSHEIPGASVAVIDDGHLTTVQSGHGDLKGFEPVQPADQFRLASITKTYIAALAVSLDSEGLVSLDEPIRPWLTGLPPGFDLDRVTMRQLLSHTSGLAQTLTDDRDRGKQLSIEDVLARIPPPACGPGLCWSYADGNYVVAAMVLEAATGRSLETEMRDRFFRRLDLESTHFFGGPKAVPLVQYRLAVDPATSKPMQPPRLLLQSLPIVTDDRAATIVATAADLAMWGDALFSGRATGAAGVKRMLSSEAMRDLPCPEVCPFEYGLGVFHYQFGGREFVGHDGSSGAIIATDRAARLTIAILSNGGEQDTGRFFEAVLQAVDRR